MISRAGSAGGRATRSAIAAVAFGIAFLCYRVVRIRRAHVTDSLLRAGLDAKYAYRMYRELALSLVELFVVALCSPSAARFVDIDDETADRLRAARARGNVMLFCAHTSNWELMAMRAASLFPLALVVKPLSSRWAARFITRARTKAGIRVIETGGALKAARAAHARGEIVATVIDQVPRTRAHGDLVPFLGAPALVNRSPAVMAKRAHATAFVIMADRDSRPTTSSSGAVAGAVRVRIVDEISADDVTRLSSAALMRRATACLDLHVRAHPSSWLWLHRRWNEPRSARVSDPFIGREKAVIGAK